MANNIYPIALVPQPMGQFKKNFNKFSRINPYFFISRT